MPEKKIIRRLALDLVNQLTEEEFKQVFQWQKSDYADPITNRIEYQLAFLKYRLSTPEIIPYKGPQSRFKCFISNLLKIFKK